MANYEIAELDQLKAVKCPCGWSHRAFVLPDNPVASVHLVEITADARPHYHRKLTEIYLIIEGKGYLELDGQRVP